MAVLGEEQKKLQQEREDLLTKQFAKSRARLGGVKREAQRESKKGFQRLQARTGSVGGSLEKARQAEERRLARDIGELETGLQAQEAAAQQELKGQEQALLEAATGRAQQAEQFGETLAFQKDSFAQQMALQWAEFDESLKSNLINAAVALKESGLKSATDWLKIAGAGQAIFGERFPQLEGVGIRQEGPLIRTTARFA